MVRSVAKLSPLRPEYVEKLRGIERERAIPVRNFARRYGLR
ncbi:MAG TPA: hypothetical protein VGR51_03385 [Thermoplasmata archaeon]|jgi:hypothetical protein|nr:hypothetical protein [Thermoplasmata archaeon]